ncbi:DUF4339 domain-containing protein [Lacipirellula parvula]|uniref:GYF domain-containing protein n=1 Tax=Lacipirellula parvula TaxID=2650471 RepID=A0A5K7X784_9BACT|nr:DUF4339 domain-containing protein [Lacipirellula parvula]BBO32235.1 hypothetical protein PLANPX_1847 [Lacipirellula parvula]
MATKTEWFVNKSDKTYGPFTSAQLKELANTGKIKPDTQIRMGVEGKWTSAEKVKGLFDSPSRELAPAVKPPAVRSTTVATRSPAPPARAIDIIEAGQNQSAPVATSTTHRAIAVPAPAAPPVVNRLCPFCGESIAPTAIKCRHCNEFLDGRPREQAQPVAQTVFHAAPAAAPVNVVVNQVVGMHHGPRWSRGVAIVLSFLIPGLGQMYKGQIFNGLAWFIVTTIGYFALVIPGLVLHLCCIIGAASGDPYR